MVQRRNKDQFTVDIPAADSSTLTFEEAANDTISRWSGQIEVSSPELGIRRISLDYNEIPAGRWGGSAYYFAQFGDDFLDEWIAGTRSINEVGNAFVQRWAAFKNGWSSIDEFKAMIFATKTGSWKLPVVDDLCPTGKACFLYNNPAGYVEYSENTDLFPVPQDVFELPFSMSLQQNLIAADPATQYTGKINSDRTLHFPGDPMMTFSYANDPTSCTSSFQGLLPCHD